MRLKLGLAVSTMSVASLLVVAAPTTAAPADTTATPTTTESTAVPDSTAPDQEPPAEPTPTGDAPGEAPVPGWLTGAATIGTSPVDDPAMPDRAEEPVQVLPTTTTTTTTTTTLPPPPPTQMLGLPFNSGTGRRAVYSKSEQRVWAVDRHGIVIKTHRVSGKQLWCDPKVGTYRVFSRSRYTFSLNNPDIIWGYMVRFTKGCNGGNIGFHEIPTDKTTGRKVQSVAQLGTPLSGGCVRQALPDAQWMWNWAYVGTKVVVLP